MLLFPTAGSATLLPSSSPLIRGLAAGVALPSDGSYNGRFKAQGGGGYAGTLRAPTGAIQGGYAGAYTDTGHSERTGEWGMDAETGAANQRLQDDFSFRSEHLMSVVGRQLVQAYYGKPPVYTYWNGCSTGGRQGLEMAQHFPTDWDGILSGCPAIHW